MSIASSDDNNNNNPKHSFFMLVPEVSEQTLAFCDALIDELFGKLGNILVNLNTSSLLTQILRLYRIVGKETGAQLHARANAFLQRKADLTEDKVKETLTSCNYL